ncbi:MAG: phospholipid carrier-dependent glycosyltransferase [bacterium]
MKHGVNKIFSSTVEYTKNTSLLVGTLFNRVLLLQQWLLTKIDVFAQLGLAALSAFLHFWRITVPAGPVFDEVYFPVFANNYLEGTSFFDTHPPLGKYLIAVGIRFFGYNPLGIRVMAALFGVLVIVVIYRLAKLLFNSRRVAFLAGLFAALDGLLLVESRAGLINIFALFFSLSAYYLFLRSGEEDLAPPQWLYLAGAGVCIGAATAVKWIGAASLGVILMVYLFSLIRNKLSWLKNWTQRKTLVTKIGRIQPLVFVACCLLLPLLLYASTFVIHLQQNPQYSFIELHKQMFGYHSHLQEGHHYASEWWSWPLLLRPVSYYWEIDGATQQASSILNLGNPALWWLAIPAVAFGLWAAFFRRDFGAQFALLALCAHYLPFAIISRATFLYHFLGALPFTIILLAFALNRLWLDKGWRRELAALAIFAIILCAVYFFPIWTAWPTPEGAFYQRMWFLSWI